MYFYLIFVVIILPLAITTAGYFLLKRRRIKIFGQRRQCNGGRGKILHFFNQFLVETFV